MKVYTRVRGCLVGVLFRQGTSGNSDMLNHKRWIINTAWSNQDLKDRRFFRLVGNNFRLK